MFDLCQYGGKGALANEDRDECRKQDSFCERSIRSHWANPSGVELGAAPPFRGYAKAQKDSPQQSK